MSTNALAIRPEALPAWHSLSALLIDLADEGRGTPCQRDPEPFTSEQHRDRREASNVCETCPAREPCATFAALNLEPFGVWGGRDHGPRTRRADHDERTD